MDEFDRAKIVTNDQGRGTGTVATITTRGVYERSGRLAEPLA